MGNYTPQRKSNSANIYVCGSDVCERMKLLIFKRNRNQLQMFERVNKTRPEWWFRNVHAKQLEVKAIHDVGDAESSEKTWVHFCYVSTWTNVESYRRWRPLKSSYFFQFKLTWSHDSSWNHVLSLRSMNAKVEACGWIGARACTKCVPHFTKWKLNQVDRSNSFYAIVYTSCETIILKKHVLKFRNIITLKLCRHAFLAMSSRILGIQSCNFGGRFTESFVTD